MPVPRRPSSSLSPHLPSRLRWSLSLGGALALGLTGWLLTPALAGTDWTIRLAPLLLALAGWAVLNRRIDRAERAANARLVEALTAARDPDLKASLDEIGSVRQRLDAVLARLKTQRFGAGLTGRYLYQLPWYLVIGAPGSGKTTALGSARLGTPLADGDIAEPIANLGGTRNCDWWFTDEAVLIDTAGRYTTQDSRRAIDGRVWSGLLDLLKEHRPRQPANGVLLTVSLPDLAAWTAAERHGHAITVRQRLNELRTQLGVRVPVYVLLTKADLVPGFATFFDPLDRAARQQVWGLAFPAEEAPEGPLPAFYELFAGLVRRLDERLLDRLHQEPDIGRRSDAFAFPLRIAELETALADLVDTAFAPEAAEEVPLLRGIYLTSATRTDRMAPDPLSPGAGEPADTHFLDRLLPEMVFPEAGLAGVDRALEQRRRRNGILSAGGALAAGLLLGGFWLHSHAGNAALLDRADSAAASVEAALRPLDTPPRSLARVDDTDVAAILPALDGLRALPMGYAERASWAAPELAGGLYQGDRIAGPAGEVYRRALRTLFLARLTLRLEEQLRTNWARPDLLRAALRAYRMIGGREAMDSADLAEWLALDWQRSLPGPANEARRRALGDHLAALFEAGFAPIPVDETLVARVEEVLAQAAPPRPASAFGSGSEVASP
ncbi:type VI secretion system membrane subunit TssM [Azospirillum doebereinerae]|uniref:type VI secretion system membrane subunit TssM n=2 Tax=Azospirillum doebereinerae TaxID=92933 RepID=UPI00384BD7E8